MPLRDVRDIVVTVGGLAVAGGVGYGIYQLVKFLSPEPAPEITDLQARYWSGLMGRDRYYKPGAQVPIIDKQSFGGQVAFKARMVEEPLDVGFWCDVEGRQVWAGPKTIRVQAGRDWKSYAVDVEGVFAAGALRSGAKIHTFKVVAGAQGAVLVQDRDTEVFKMVPERSDIWFTTPNDWARYWSEHTGSYDWRLPGSLLGIYDGQEFGVKFRFMHRYMGGTFMARAGVHVEDDFDWGEAMITVPYDVSEQEYEVEVWQVLNRRGLLPCRRFDVLKEVRDESGNRLAYAWDADCLHLLG